MNSGWEQKDMFAKLPEAEIEVRLWEYMDGLSTAAEKDAIQNLIAENSAWRTKYGELLQLHQSIGAMELEQPSMRFTRNVMEAIAKHQIAPATRKYINNKIIWGIAAFFITVIAGFLVYGISQIDWSAGSNESIGNIDFTQVDYSAMFGNTFVNGFMMANIILGLLLLDRYLAHRKKEWQ